MVEIYEKEATSDASQVKIHGICNHGSSPWTVITRGQSGCARHLQHRYVDKESAAHLAIQEQARRVNRESAAKKQAVDQRLRNAHLAAISPDGQLLPRIHLHHQTR
jgi:hypothetical protein